MGLFEWISGNKNKEIQPSNEEVKKVLVNHLSHLLAKSGFKQKENSIIREPEDGLYQIINVSLGQVTSAIHNHIGIGFGITTEEWIENINTWKRPKNITTSHCEIRDHYCTLLKKIDKNTWYPTKLGQEKLNPKIVPFLIDEVLPVLNRLDSRKKIIREWEMHGQSIGLPPRHELSIGILKYFSENKEEGKRNAQKRTSKKSTKRFL